MDAKELYEKSLINHKSRQNTGLSTRVYNVLARGGLTEKDGSINLGKILQEVESGRIWLVNGVGEKTIKDICEWIAKEGSS